jgi:outer membrane receptor for ferrienterochelin and colicins
MSLVRSLCLSCLLVLLTCSLTSAQIHGFVIDGSDNTPIAGARITLNAPSGNIWRLSHSNGEFTLETPPDGREVTIHAYGYHDTVIAVAAFAVSREALRVKLQINILLRFDVTVTAQKKLEAIQDVPVSVSTVAAREIESRAPSGLDNVLRYIPGVSVTESELNIRGSSGYARSIGSRVLVLMDGMPFLSADNGDVKFDALPLFDVERVEVVKGAGSALYGSSALGGVVNVITRTAAEGTHFAIMSTAGEYDQPSYDSWKVPGLGRRFLDGDIGVSSSAGDNATILSAGFKRNEGYRLGDDYYRLHAFGKLMHRLNENSALTLSGLVANEDHGGWLYWKSLAQPLEPSDSLSAINGRIHSLKANAMAKYTATINDEILADVNLNLLHTKFTTDPTQAGGVDGNHSTAYAPYRRMVSYFRRDSLLPDGYIRSIPEPSWGVARSIHAVGDQAD